VHFLFATQPRGLAGQKFPQDRAVEAGKETSSGSRNSSKKVVDKSSWMNRLSRLPVRLKGQRKTKVIRTQSWLVVEN
jgi:hypothetical protein